MSDTSPTAGQRPSVHVALVSDQAVPNLTPALDPVFQPREVVLVVSPDKAARARWLEDVLHKRGIRCTKWPIDDAWDIEHVKTRIWELLDARDGEALALNATGGTKPMSIAAYEVFRDWKLPIFYVHPEQDLVIWLHPSNQPSFHLADRALGRIGLTPEFRVLDLATGRGLLANACSERDHAVLGLDFADKLLKRAWRRFLRLDIHTPTGSRNLAEIL